MGSQSRRLSPVRRVRRKTSTIIQVPTTIETI
jgi:hypothetical protein